MIQEDIVREYRDKIIMGKCIDLVPIKDEFLQDIVDLRNQERSRYFLIHQYTSSNLTK